MEFIVLKSGGHLYRIPRVPFEPLSQTCERGWYLIGQTNAANPAHPANLTKSMKSTKSKNTKTNATTTPETREILSEKTPEERFQDSFKWLYEKQGMTYSFTS
jgi:hypothetical protein